MTVTTTTATPGAITAPGRPVRDPDPERNAAYWARIDRVVRAAPPLSDDQRAQLRAIFHQPGDRKEQAA